jgi:hypothetical protein
MYEEDASDDHDLRGVPDLQDILRDAKDPPALAAGGGHKLGHTTASDGPYLTTAQHISNTGNAYIWCYVLNQMLQLLAESWSTGRTAASRCSLFWHKVQDLQVPDAGCWICICITVSMLVIV